jgi:hypothetical protein
MRGESAMKLLHHIGERGDEVAVVSHGDDHEIARFRYAELDRYIAAGHLSTSDLFDRRPAGEARLCRRLALLACARQCREEATTCDRRDCLAHDCLFHAPDGEPRRNPAGQPAEIAPLPLEQLPRRRASLH